MHLTIREKRPRITGFRLDISVQWRAGLSSLVSLCRESLAGPGESKTLGHPSSLTV